MSNLKTVASFSTEVSTRQSTGWLNVYFQLVTVLPSYLSIERSRVYTFVIIYVNCQR